MLSVWQLSVRSTLTLIILLSFGLLARLHAETVRTFRQLTDLKQEEALKGQPVQIKGVVLCYDAGWNQLYIYDGDQAVYLDPQLSTSQLAPGLSVEITGRTVFSGGRSWLTNLDLAILGPGRLPVA